MGAADELEYAVAPVNPMVKSYRYLRIALVAMVVLLGWSVVLEMRAAGWGCWRTSISSYYFTPARGVFIGALVTVGVALIALKGTTPRQDLLLNFAGLLAPVVAFVPIQDPHECQSVPPVLADARPNIANNVTALLLTGVCVILVAYVIARREGLGHLDRSALVGLVLAVAVTGAGVAWFKLGRDSFDRWAHYAAAIPLFVCIVAVTLIDAFSYGRTRADQEGRAVERSDYRNRYLLIAVLMAVSVPIMLAVMWLGHWRHGTLWIEITVIVLFAAFFAVQTQELWDEPQGVRADPKAT